VYPSEDFKSLRGNIARYEENIHPKTDKGDSLVFEEGLCVDLEGLNYVKLPTLEWKFYGIWKKYTSNT
jgi:hypothetical protein